MNLDPEQRHHNRPQLSDSQKWGFLHVPRRDPTQRTLPDWTCTGNFAWTDLHGRDYNLY